MDRHRSTNRLVLAVVLGAIVAGAGPAVGAGSAPALYQGRFTGGISWQPAPDGSLAPSLAQAQAWAETDRPALAARDLKLLVPLDAALGGLEIVPLATHRERVPGRLAAGQLLLSSEAKTVSTARHPNDADQYPQAWGEFGGTQVWRGFRVALVRVFPLRAWRDATGAWTEVEVLDRYEVRALSANAATPAADYAVRERWLPGERAQAEATLGAVIDNPEALSGYARADGAVVIEPTGGFAPTETPALSGSTVRYVIITRDALAPTFQRLADHRTALGIPTVVKSVEWILANYRHGADVQETIRGFIREAYQRWGVEYVLLAGDTDQLPPRYVTSSYYPPNSSTDIPADLYFGCLDGNWNANGNALYGEPYFSYLNPGDNADFADEVRIGRATVSTVAAANTFIDKVTGYEQQAAGVGWPNRMLFAGEVLFPADYTPGASITLDGATFAEQIINNSLTPFTGMTATRMYESSPLWPGSVALTRAALIDSLNSGHFGIVNQIGHGYFFNMSVGDANFTLADADNLHNTGRPFLLYALNCASAAFDYSCLMERFVQNPGGGSVASIGAVRAAFPYTANTYQAEFFRLLFSTSTRRLGDLMSQSRLPMLVNTYYNTADRWTFLNYTLLGDPGLPVWNGAPRAPTIAAPATLAAGAQNVNVTVTAGGLPVAGALVCLSKTTDDYVSALTDAGGVATLAYTPVSAGTASLRVSGAGLAITSRSLPVTMGGAYIALSNMTVVDDGTLGSIGNGDGRIDAGETVALMSQYHDNGAGGATGCVATLTGSLSGLTILTGTAAVGTVPSGGTKAATQAFLLRADQSLPDGYHAAFTVTVSAAAGGPWQTKWNPVLVAPEVAPIALTWSDQAFGNGDGTLQANERITVSVRLKNYGAGLSGTITARLRTADPAVTLRDTVATCASLGLLQDGVNASNLSFSQSDVATAHPCWILYTDPRGRTFRHNFRIATPAAPGAPTPDTALGPNVIVLTWAPVSSARQRGYHVYHSTSPTGPFTRANLDLIEGTSYFRDDGLSLLTQYFYKVAAVDSSLIEGPASVVISQSTAPAEQAGFPLPFAAETSSHAAVGDVDGDGRLEIVLGADEVYVWTASGGELRDGDHNAQTFGPLTNLAGSFGPGGIALADLDGVPGVEIIVGDSKAGQQKLHILRKDGSELPGWPRTLLSWCWTTPAVGDVDGDGQPEIVVNDIAGRTYVWHKNGTELRDGDSNPATDGVFAVRAGSLYEYSFSSPALYDVDRDGRKDIVFGSKVSGQPNYLYAYRYDGTQAAGFPFATGTRGLIACSPSIGDLNNDGVADIVFVADSDSLYVVKQTGQRYPGFPIYFPSRNAAAGVSCPSPALGDFRHNGKLQIVAVSTAYPPAVSAALTIIDTDVAGGTSGQVLAGWPKVLPGNSESSPVVGDINGDGILDVVYGIGGGNESTPDNLYAFSGTGAPIAGFPITLGGPVRPCPVLCDLNGDGKVNIVYGGWDLKIHVWDLPYAYDASRMPWATFRGSNWRDGVFGRRSAVAVPGETPAAALALAPNFPNPFNPTTTVRLYVPGAAGTVTPLRLGIYDLRGRLVRSLQDGHTPTGWRSWIWDGRDSTGRSQASGVYLLRAESGGQVRTQKLALVK